LGAGTGRVVTWFNQTGITANLGSVGTSVWTSGTSPITSLSAIDQPRITAASPFPTFAGWTSTPNPGVSYVKLIPQFEMQTTFTVMMWVKQSISDNQYRSVFSLGMWTTGIVIRSDSTMVCGNVLTNSALNTTRVPLNTWTHIALTRDKNNLVTLWISRSSVTSMVVAGTVLREPSYESNVSRPKSIHKDREHHTKLCADGGMLESSRV
jgi:hypothetical protein